LSLEDAIKRGNEAASRWLENQKNEIPSAAVVKAFDEDCAGFQGLKNSDKAVVQAFMQTRLKSLLPKTIEMALTKN